MADDQTITTPVASEEADVKPADLAPTEKTTDIKSETTVPVVSEEAPKEEAASTESLETSTANDGNISINQPEDTKSEEKTVEPKIEEVKTEEPKITETPITPEPAAETPTEPATEAPISSESSPVVVNSEDVQAVEEPGSEKLQEQIESLTGEIQALEAKIERLTSGSATPVETPAEEPTPTPEPAKPTEPEEKSAPVESENTPELASAEKPEPTPAPASFAPTPIPVATPAPATLPTLPSVQKSADNEDVQVEHTSAVAVISEVLVILGTILFVILAATPFFREMAGEDLYSVISSVGWLTITVTLLLGTLMATFGKAKAAITLTGFIFLLLSAFMYLGMNYPSLLGPLESSLSGIFNFYK